MKWWALPHYIWEPHIPKNPTFFPPLFFSSLHPACPSFSSHPTPPYPTHSMPNSVLRIHLQIKQIYHSVTEAGKGGRLWNALAPGAGKGSEHCAMLPCVLPCCTLLHLLSLILSLRAPPPNLPMPSLLLSYLYPPNPTKPSEHWPTAQNRTGLNKETIPRLLRGQREAAAWPGLTDFQLWSPVTPNNTLPDNQIGDKLQDKCAAWE